MPLATTAAEHCASAATELPAETNTKTSIDQTPIPEPPRALDPGAAEVKAAALPTSASKSPLPLRHHRKKAVAIVGVVVALITAAALGWLEMSRRKGPALPKESAGRNTSLDARRSPASAARDSRPSGLLPTARDHSSRPLASLDGSRSPDFVDGVSSLDTESLSQDKRVPRALREAIRNEFAKIPQSERPIAIVARCYLGHPYEVHILDCQQETAEHFKIGQPLPLHLERARQLARHSNYAFIEVYAQQLRAIGKDGTVATLQM